MLVNEIDLLYIFGGIFALYPGHLVCVIRIFTIPCFCSFKDLPFFKELFCFFKLMNVDKVFLFLF